MISMVQPLPVGNALRLFLEPPADAVRWRVLRKGSGVFTGPEDESAVVVYDGTDTILTDSHFLQNQVMAFYCAFYTADDGVTWVASAVASGTPDATYEETTTDVLSFLRDRLELGLKVEVERGKLVSDLGYVQCYTASPSMERDLTFPLVTVHLESEDSSERGLGEDIAGEFFEDVDTDTEGWLADVRVTIIGWSLNSDERIELRKAIRRVLLANQPLFSDLGWILPSLSQQDIDAVNGEYPANIFQVMSNFTCQAPVRVTGNPDVPFISQVLPRRTNG